ncbi:MAG: ABC transporter ATP-binding protein [Anaeromyxobacter sp.]
MSLAPAASYLQIRDVVKDFGSGTLAVNHVNLDIQKGEIFALLGSSGCGKTTLLRMLAGFETPTQGTIVLDGQNLAGLPPYLRPINMMFQSYALFPHLSVWENVAFGLKREGMPKKDIAERVEQMLKLVQLQKYGKRKPHQLSGGQQQRVALARSLAKRPQLMLLDEPLGALDKKLREETQVELVNIIREVGVTCVMVTHDQEEAMTMATRIAVMSEGKILQVGSPTDVYETPATRFVADFIGNVNLMDGKVVVDEPNFVEIDCGFCRHRVGHGITGNLGMPVAVAVRPEKIHLAREKPAGEVNQVKVTVRDRSYFGSYTVYVLEVDGGRRLKVSESNVERHRASAPAPGETAWATWPDTAQVVLTA